MPEHGAHQCVEPVFRVHVPGRFRLQSRLDQPDEVRAPRRRVRRGRLQGRLPDAHHGAGNPRRQFELSDAGDCQEQPCVSAARPGLRQSRRAAHVARSAVRQRRRPRLCCGAHRNHDWRGLRAIGTCRPRSGWPVCGVRGQSRAVPARHAEASRRGEGDQSEERAGRVIHRRTADLGRGGAPG